MSFDIKVPDGWSLVKLSDLGEVNRGRSRHRPRDAAHLYDGPYPFVQTGDVKASGGRITEFSQTYSEAGLAQSRLWPIGTMCITIAANIAETGILTFPACFPDSVIGFIADEKKCNVYFIEFVFRLLRKRIQAQATGSVQDNINLQTLERLQFPIPTLEDQNKIAAILGKFDDKIYLNNATNQTLEEMAQAIFKSWFVDFDPVKAKMNGEQPEGMDEATASLFPDKLVESEIGLIPDGWAIKPIKDLCTKVQNGGTPKRNETSYWDDGTIPWLTSGEVRQSIITAVENRITQLGLDKSSAKWVPELSTLVALYGATAGEVSLTSIPLTTNQAVCALMPKKEHQWYNYLQLKNRVAELAGKAVGSAQQNISKGLVESTEVLSVPESLLEAFNSQVENLFRLRICNLNENVELAKLRDTLLPKLLSGEIELGTSEELVEAI
jgi:type I restriction enzyme S subunit